MDTSKTGAQRGELTAGKLRFDLMLANGEALRRMAATWQEGFEKYGADNWKKGFPVSELINHAQEHLIRFCEGDKTEDHLSHAVWNLMLIMWEEKHKPELIDYPISEKGLLATLHSQMSQAEIDKVNADINKELAAAHESLAQTIERTVGDIQHRGTEAGREIGLPGALEKVAQKISETLKRSPEAGIYFEVDASEIGPVAIAGYTHLLQEDQVIEWAANKGITCVYDPAKDRFSFLKRPVEKAPKQPCDNLPAVGKIHPANPYKTTRPAYFANPKAAFDWMNAEWRATKALVKFRKTEWQDQTGLIAPLAAESFQKWADAEGLIVMMSDPEDQYWQVMPKPLPPPHASTANNTGPR